MDLPPLRALGVIAAIMVPTVLVCAWLLDWVRQPRYYLPPPPRKKPRKRPVDMGPETRFADRFPSDRSGDKHTS
jgi:hypothetical protein